MRIEKILLNLTQCKFFLSIKCYRYLNALLTHSPNWNEKIRFWAIANFSQFKVFDVVCNRMLNRQFTIFNKYYIEHRENDKATKKNSFPNIWNIGQFCEKNAKWHNKRNASRLFDITTLQMKYFIRLFILLKQINWNIEDNIRLLCGKYGRKIRFIDAKCWILNRFHSIDSNCNPSDNLSDSNLWQESKHFLMLENSSRLSVDQSAMEYAELYANLQVNVTWKHYYTHSLIQHLHKKHPCHPLKQTYWVIMCCGF